MTQQARAKRAPSTTRRTNTRTQASGAASVAPGLPAEPRWYKDAIIYEVHVRAFADSNGDGIGDFPGLTSRLDHIRDLGATAIWLLPFYPSPLRDDGYDIAEYRGVNPAYGTLRDVRKLITEAHKRGLRVITELVINHTSDQHPWFQRARKAPAGSPEREFYVWSDTPDRYKGVRIIFNDTERSNWTWDERAGAYYWHRFFSHQPDLNFDNPAVQDAVIEVMDQWFEMGVDGMRLDAVPYLFEREGTNCENLPETHDFLRKLRAHVDATHEGKMLLAEANQWPEDAIAYFGKGDECHMNFHFPLMPRLFMSLRMEDRFPLIDILEQTPDIPDSCQWAIFLRNHDELTLEMVTDEERDYMYRVYAEDRQARINFGIRRRLAPLLDNDRKKIELLNGLLFSLPGTPVLYYGDEIGMGDNYYLGDRDAVRTPMQWSGDRNAGFSRANPQKLFLPVIIDPGYHYETVNVESQEESRSSLLWWMRRIIALRKRWKVFGHGSIEFLHPENGKVLAFLRELDDQVVLVVANLSRFVQAVELDLSRFRGSTPVEMFGRTDFPEVGELPYLLTVGPHNFYWFSLEWRDGREQATGASDGPAAPRIELKRDAEAWARSQEGREALAGVLSADLPRRRWFGAKSRRIQGARIADAGSMRARVKDLTSYLALLEFDYADGESDLFFLPLALASSERAVGLLGRESPSVVAELSRSRSGGEAHWTIFEGQHDPEVAKGLLELARKKSSVRLTGGAGGEIVGWMTPGSTRALRKASAGEPRALKGEQSNTSIVYGDSAILKVFRRVEAGVNPDLEVSRHLTEDVGFKHTPRLLGAVEYVPPRGETLSLCMVQEYVENEGDAWTYVVDQALQFLERAPHHAESLARVSRGEPGSAGLIESARDGQPGEAESLLEQFAVNAELLGTRTAELHAALATAGENEAFEPEPFTKLYLRSLYQAMRNSARRTIAMISKRAKGLEGAAAQDASRVAASEKEIVGRLERVSKLGADALRIRRHGDYHLGQVLWTGKDYVIIDFEGEPARSLGERRLKRSPVSDVAGMLRSFQYAAYTGLERVRERGLLDAADDEVDFTKWTRLFERWSASAFLRAYLEQSDNDERTLIPRDDASLATLLEAWLIEKAMYEVRYELDNRPNWVGIPLRGILELLEGGSET